MISFLIGILVGVVGFVAVVFLIVKNNGELTIKLLDWLESKIPE